MMVKNKIRKSFPKKKKKLSKKQRRPPRDEKKELPEVSKELYEIQISDLNDKLRRTKQQCLDLEEENVEIKASLTQINEDRADVIAYLNRSLHERNDDIIELQEQVTTLQQAREIERSKLLDTINTKENEFKKLHDRLNMEINLLNGKLNTLDEFRVQKEELTKKFQQQEEAQKLQELQHQESLRNTEKDFLLKKVRIKQEVEEKLIKLSEDFQTIMQSKIDATTKVTIVENNSLKIEMKKVMNTCKDLIRENNDLNKQVKELNIKLALIKDELNESIKKYICIKKKLGNIRTENDLLKSQARVNVNTYLKQIEDLNEMVGQYKIDLAKQIETGEQLNHILSVHKKEDHVVNEKFQKMFARVENTERVLKQAALITQQILSNATEKRNIDHGSRMAFASSLLEILKMAEIEGHPHLVLNFKY